MTRHLELTDHQAEIVRLVGGELLSYKAAGARLGISARTVEWHVQELRARALIPKSPRSAMVVLFQQNGLAR